MTQDGSSLKRGAEQDDNFRSDSPSKKRCLGKDNTSDSSSASTKCKIFACVYEGCNKTFDRPSKLEIHTRCHTNERPFACNEPDCDKTFQRNEHLTRHMKDKHGVGDLPVHRCTYLVPNGEGEDVECGKVLATASKLRRHVSMHEAKEALKCREAGCGKFFRTQETLERHVKQEHLGVDAFSCCESVITSTGEVVECGETFATIGLLKGHQSRSHGGYRFFCDRCTLPPEFMDAGIDEDGTVSQIAPQLGFVTYAEFQNHMKIEHPPSCPDCGMQCESARALRAHQDIVHSSSEHRQRFQCTWSGCDRRFTKAGNLNVHIQTVHQRSKGFVCGLFDLSDSKKVQGWQGQGCGRALTTKASLEEHIRTQHLGLPSKLRKRVKPEFGDSPSTLMDIDEAPTPSDTDRAVALLTGHGYEDSRPIACLQQGCQFRFVRDYDLVQHVELTHDWHIDDVHDAIAERDALSGDQFWIGGGETLANPTALQTAGAASLHESALHARLHHAVHHALPPGEKCALVETDRSPIYDSLDPALQGKSEEVGLTPSVAAQTT